MSVTDNLQEMITSITQSCYSSTVTVN